MQYRNKDLKTYFLSDLENILKGLQAQEAGRNKAASHVKFTKMPFPPPNPEFIKLKSAIEEEIKSRKK